MCVRTCVFVGVFGGDGGGGGMGGGSRPLPLELTLAVGSKRLNMGAFFIISIKGEGGVTHTHPWVMRARRDDMVCVRVCRREREQEEKVGEEGGTDQAK